MTDSHPRSAASIFEAALDVPADERAAFVEAACAGDPVLVSEVMGLLAADAEASSFLDAPVRLDDLIDGTGEFEPDAHPDLGRELGAFRIERMIGRGGMGSVFLGRRTRDDFEQKVAIKILRRGMDTDDLLARFRRERRLLARLEHPNIAGVIDGGSTDDGRPWLAMEYVDGAPIDVHCDERRLAPRARIALFLDVCAAVQHAHRSLIVHRDLKPGNVYVAGDGTVKLLDFGIAKVLDPDDVDTAATATHVRLLSPRYGSPEQLRGEPIGTASDVYSLGVLLYELLTGRSPYADEKGELVDIERRVLREEPTAPSTAVTVQGTEGPAIPGVDTALLRRSLRGDLDTIVLKAMRKDPDRRYSSVDEFAEDLRRHLDGRPVLARPDSLSYRTKKFVGRNALAVGAAAIVAVALITATAISTTAFLRAERAQREAEAERSSATAVAGFLQEIFGSIDPSVAQGDDTTLLRRLLADAERRIDTELAGRPRVAASLHHTLGRAYLSLTELDEAESHLRRALQLDADGDPERRVDYGAYLVEAGDYDEAEAVLDEAMAVADARGDTLASARARLFRGRVYEARQDYDRARAHLIEAERLLDDAGLDEQRVSLLGALAIFITYNDHDYARADSIMAVARDLVERTDVGAFHTGNTWQLSATVKRRRGAYATADSMYRLSHEEYLKILEPDHAQVASLQDVWATSLEEQGRFDEAEELYRKAFATLERIYGREHRLFGTIANNLANCLRKAGKYDEAVPLFEQAVAAYQAALGEEHVWVSIVLGNHATNHLLRGDLEAARAVAAECIRMRELYWPPDHWRVTTVRALEGAARAQAGDVDEGEAAMLDALATIDAKDGPDSPHAEFVLERLREHFERTGRAAPPELTARF